MPEVIIEAPTDDTPEEQTASEQNKTRRKRYYLLFGFSLLVCIIIVGIIVGVVVSLLGKGSDDTPQPTAPQPTTLPPGTKTTCLQVGNDIDGLNPGDEFGKSVSMSSSNNMLVVGAPAYNTGRPGMAQLYELNSLNDEWDKLGQLLVGDANTNDEEDWFGYAVSVSDDGTVIAISAINNNDKGSVYIYNIIETSLSSSTNNKKELELVQTLYGDSEYDTFGVSLSVSGDGTTIAVGADLFYNDGPGYVKVYQNDKTGSKNTNQYNLIGNALNGKSTGDRFGFSTTLSYDGSVLTVGAPQYNTGKHGYVQIYQYNDFGNSNNNNLLKGDDAYDDFGHAVASSSNGVILAISAPGNDGFDGDKDDCGTIKILKLNTTDNKWHQLGDNIDGEDEGDWSGRHQGVSLSNSGTIVAIGSPGNDDNGSDSGSVRIFEYVSNTNKWIQISQDLDGEAEGDYSGYSISLNGDGNMVAIGAPLADGNGDDSGHVRVYRRGDTNALQ